MAFPYRKILCPIDFDENSMRALDKAIEIARHFGAAVLLVHALPLVSRPVNKCSIADAAFDLMGGFGPAEGSGGLVPVGQEAGDGLLQARDAVEAAAANGLRGD